jgi:SOS response regulatory protein OraA/RecX
MKARRASKETALEMAVRILARRRYFSREVEARLLKRFSGEDTRAVLRKLVTAGYLNDEETSLAAVEEWVLKRGRGVRWVEVLLRKYRLEDDIESAAKAHAENLEHEGAAGVARRLLKLGKKIPEIQTALYRRGFRPATVEALLSSIGGVTNNGNDEYFDRSHPGSYRGSSRRSNRHRSRKNSGKE